MFWKVSKVFFSLVDVKKNRLSMLLFFQVEFWALYEEDPKKNSNLSYLPSNSSVLLESGFTNADILSLC